jgi:hypothetical protein
VPACLLAVVKFSARLVKILDGSRIALVAWLRAHLIGCVEAVADRLEQGQHRLWHLSSRTSEADRSGRRTVRSRDKQWSHSLFSPVSAMSQRSGRRDRQGDRLNLCDSTAPPCACQCPCAKQIQGPTGRRWTRLSLWKPSDKPSEICKCDEADHDASPSLFRSRSQRE